ncbi:MAG: hypothetical protein COB38_12385 [Gammaproteobacteria bacterium]|nr:MAG: hypothetical protein COB38_12385 [Gammaproteobacteria bacterium]
MSLFNKAKELLEKNIEAGKEKAEQYKQAQAAEKLKQEIELEKEKKVLRDINKIQIITGNIDIEHQVLGGVKGYGFSSHDPRAVWLDTQHDDSKITKIATEAETKAFRVLKKMAYDLGADHVIYTQIQNLSTNQIIDISTKMLNTSSAKVNRKLIRETFVYGTAIKTI